MGTGEAIEKCKRAVIALGTKFPHFLPIHAHLRSRYIETDSIPTMAISSDGTLSVNPTFVLSLPLAELSGVLAHEMMHLILQHSARAQARNHLLWNCACDMAINTALRTDNLRLPGGALYPPSDYTGELLSEDIYDFLVRTAWRAPTTEGLVGCGCGVERASTVSDIAPTDWAQVSREVSALVTTLGRGSTAVGRLLNPRAPRIAWQRILRHGFNLACARVARDFTSMSRRSRRSPLIGVQFPGWVGIAPQVAIVIDVSGSMAREWIDQIVAECLHLLALHAGSKAYLVSHTDVVVWQGWVRAGASTALTSAVQFTGGTSASGAYQAVKDAGRFDCLIHFTDCEIGFWPANPARKLIVAAFGSGATKPACPPPPGAEIIPCQTP